MSGALGSPDTATANTRPRGLLEPKRGRGLLNIVLDEPEPPMPSIEERAAAILAALDADWARAGADQQAMPPGGSPDPFGPSGFGAGTTGAPLAGAAVPRRGLGLLNVDPAWVAAATEPPPEMAGLPPEYAPWVQKLGGLLGVFLDDDQGTTTDNAAPATGGAYAAMRANLDDGSRDPSYGGEGADVLQGSAGDDDLRASDGEQIAQTPVPPQSGSPLVTSDLDEASDVARKGRDSVFNTKPLPKLHAPVVGPLTVRRDEHGGGMRGDPRSTRNPVTGKTYRYSHEGTDIVARAGDDILSPVDGIITRVNLDPYGDHRYQGIEIVSNDGKVVRIHYSAAHATLKAGDRISAGASIGTVQDRAAGKKGMINHIHVEVWERKDGQRAAPRAYGKSEINRDFVARDPWLAFQ